MPSPASLPCQQQLDMKILLLDDLVVRLGWEAKPLPMLQPERIIASGVDRAAGLKANGRHLRPAMPYRL